MKHYQINFKSKNKKSLYNLTKFFYWKSKNLYLLNKNFTSDIKKQTTTILKSPHVNKVAQEKFQKNTYSQNINLYVPYTFKLLRFVKTINSNRFLDVKIKIKLLINNTLKNIKYKIVFNPISSNINKLEKLKIKNFISKIRYRNKIKLKDKSFNFIADRLSTSKFILIFSKKFLLNFKIRKLLLKCNVNVDLYIRAIEKYSNFVKTWMSPPDSILKYWRTLRKFELKNDSPCSNSKIYFPIFITLVYWKWYKVRHELSILFILRKICCIIEQICTKKLVYITKFGRNTKKIFNIKNTDIKLTSFIAWFCLKFHLFSMMIYETVVLKILDIYKSIEIDKNLSRNTMLTHVYKKNYFMVKKLFKNSKYLKINELFLYKKIKNWFKVWDIYGEINKNEHLIHLFNYKRFSKITYALQKGPVLKKVKL